MIQLEIQDGDLARVGSELGATSKQVRLAFGRALARTAATLRKLSERALRDKLEVRKLKFLRLRLRTVRLRRAASDGFTLWYGLNDMPIGELKGRPTKTATGAAFRGHQFAGGFVRKNKRGQPTIFKRKGGDSHPIDEQDIPIKAEADAAIEREVYDKLEKIFWAHFEKDLLARVKFRIGRT